MAESLVGLVAAWLGTPAAEGLKGSDRLVLMLIAERSHKHTREFWLHRLDRHPDGTQMTPSEVLQQRAGLTEDGLTKVLRRLADRGVEVRVPKGHRKDGTPIFASRGHATDFRVPELPASIELPARQGDQTTRRKGVDNPPPRRSPTR